LSFDARSSPTTASLWWPLSDIPAEIGICSQTNHFVAALALPKGRPPSQGDAYDWILGLVLLLYAAGLVWTATSMAIL